MLEDQKNESSEQIEDEAQQIDTGASTMEVTSKSDGSDEKPDINDVPMDEAQVIKIHPKKLLRLFKYEEEFEIQLLSCLRHFVNAYFLPSLSLDFQFVDVSSLSKLLFLFVERFFFSFYPVSYLITIK